LAARTKRDEEMKRQIKTDKDKVKFQAKRIEKENNRGKLIS
jgi:hypothetical protein